MGKNEPIGHLFNTILAERANSLIRLKNIRISEQKILLRKILLGYVIEFHSEVQRRIFILSTDLGIFLSLLRKLTTIIVIYFKKQSKINNGILQLTKSNERH